MIKQAMRGAFILAALSGPMPGLMGQAQAADLLYDFESGTQGVVVTGGLVTATDGHLVLQDKDDAEMIAWLPASDLGDWRRFLGGTLSFDAVNLNGVANNWLSFGTLRIESGDRFIERDLILAPEPAAQWTTYTLSLDEAALGPDLASVLGAVTRVGLTLESHIGFDATNGGAEINGLDNLRVTAAVPEPQSWLLLLSGLVAVGAGAVHRRRPARQAAGL
jgi:hypothetical protein